MRSRFIARTLLVLLPAPPFALLAPPASFAADTPAAMAQVPATTPPAAAGGAVAAAAGAPALPPGVVREERGNLVLEGVPPHDAAIVARLEDWLAGRSATFRDFLPDGGLLVSTRFGDVEQLHRVAQPLGAREQLTFHAEPTGSAVVAPSADAAGFAFTMDRGGDANAQVHYYRFDDRSTRMLTDGRSLHGSLAWSRDGRRLAFHGNGRDAVSYDIYVTEVAAGTAPRLLVASQNRLLQPLDWSSDGQRLLLRHYVSINESHLYVADAQNGALTPVPTSVPPGGGGNGLAALAPGGSATVAIGAARFAADGAGVWFTSDLGSEFLRLRYVDLASGAAREPFPGPAPWDIEDLEVSADGRWLAWTTNVDGISRLSLYDLGAGRELRPAGLPEGVIGNLRFDRNGGRLGMTIDTPQQPRDAYVLETGRSELVRWTRSETGPVDPTGFVPAERVRYPSWDRDGGRPRQIAAFVWKPRTPGPHPVLIDIHGGPEAQARPNFSAFTQFLVDELGYAVIAPNVRGSSGYGKTFLKLDNGALREDAVRDIGSLLVWIAAQRDLDAGRVVVSGGSYGGFMSLASMVNYGDRLRGGVSVVGISNFVTFLQNTSAYRRDLRRAEYGDERDPRMRRVLQRISPLTNASMIRKPLLVVQGLNDPRVPASESEQMVAKIRANRGEVWYLAARDEGHGFRRKSNRDFYLRTLATFLARMKE